MSYNDRFDRLGNPIYPRRTPLGHRVLQTAGLVATIVLLALLALL